MYNVKSNRSRQSHTLNTLALYMDWSCWKSWLEVSSSARLKMSISGSAEGLYQSDIITHASLASINKSLYNDESTKQGEAVDSFLISHFFTAKRVTNNWPMNDECEENPSFSSIFTMMSR